MPTAECRRQTGAGSFGRGRAGAWFRGTQARHEGHIKAGGVEKDVAFEDFPNGVRAAQTAGIRCVAVPNPVTARLDLDHADQRLDSLDQIPLADLLARLESPARRVTLPRPRSRRSEGGGRASRAGRS